MSTKLGARMKAARKAAGWTLKDVGREIGVSHVFVFGMEKQRPVPLDRMFQVCSLFPDEDSSEWLWLKLADDWGQPIVDVMKKRAVVEDVR